MRETLIQKLDILGANGDQFDASEHLETADLLQLLRMTRDTADSALEDAVGQARAEGMSWEQVGRWTGVSKQAAQQRFGQ